MHEFEHRAEQMAIYRALPWYQRARVTLAWRFVTVRGLLILARNHHALQYHRRQRGENFPLIDWALLRRDVGGLLWAIFRQPYEGEGGHNDDQ